jgi:hypothetical protein
VISVVTGFVPISDHPRSADEYYMLGQRLLDLDVPIMFSLNKIEDCWLYKYLDHSKLIITHSVADNPAKNTVAYHIVQAQKTEWLAKAAMSNPGAKVLVWIDFGIFSQPTVTGNLIRDFLARARFEQEIAIPGCWEKDRPYDDRFPHWRFCGGVMVVPRHWVVPFDDAMKRECIGWIRETGNLSWEVNTLTRVERTRPDLPIRHYRADHDYTMFRNYTPKGGLDDAIRD